MKNVITYKDGASFLDLNIIKSSKNIEWENDLTAGKGWSYGYELFLQKKILANLLAHWDIRWHGLFSSLMI